MRKAKVEFKIVMSYTTVVEQYEDDYSLEQEIDLQREYLETQGEDLMDALMNSEMRSVEITEITEIKEDPVINYQI